MAARVTAIEKELMWRLYQKHGTFKAVANILHRDKGTVSRHVREYEAAVNATSYILNMSK